MQKNQSPTTKRTTPVKRDEHGRFLPNQVPNPYGRSTPQQRYMRKLHTALDMAVDKLGERLKCDGASAIAERIADALDKDVVGTLHKLQPFFPKNVSIDVQVNKELHQLSDEDLEAIILARRGQNEKVIDADTIEGEANPPEENNEVDT